ncbi:hypothetical protein B566_EDAN013430 [Ephemera danica]|nr:hypothetical protein B566_EDAN013430 [Ephemera danica]
MKFSIAVVLGALVLSLVWGDQGSNECGRCVMKQRFVCGRDSQGHMKTFNNSCTLRRENCMHHTDYVQVRKGSC